MPEPVAYEADKYGNIYVESDDGTIWPTGTRVTRLAGQRITVEEYERQKEAHVHKPSKRDLEDGRVVAERLGLL